MTGPSVRNPSSPQTRFGTRFCFPIGAPATGFHADAFRVLHEIIPAHVLQIRTAPRIAAGLRHPDRHACALLGNKAHRCRVSRYTYWDHKRPGNSIRTLRDEGELMVMTRMMMMLMMMAPMGVIIIG